MIKVSVIVPVYKVPLEYLRACFDSLTAQTMQECEFIVVSDGAPEAECSICEEYVARDSRFKFFKREHAGVSATRNYGIDQAQGEYITFVDSDDWIKPESCQHAYVFASNNNSDVVLFDYVPQREKKHRQKCYNDFSISIMSMKEIHDILCEIVFLKNEKFVGAVSTWCKLTKRDLFVKNQIQFPCGIAVAEDRVVSYAIFQKALRVSYLKEFLYIYNFRPSSITNAFDDNTLKKNLQYLYEIKKISANHIQNIADSAMNIYFASWEKCYLNKKNKKTIFRRIHDVLSVVHSKEFRDIIQIANINKFPLIIQQEAWLLKHGIGFPFLFHMLKFLLKDTLLVWKIKK